MELTRAGIMVSDMGWMTMQNRSMENTVRPYFANMMKPLGHFLAQPPITIYGDQLNWDMMDSVRVKWANSEILQYPELLPSWSYVWDVGSSKFTVTDDANASTVRLNVHALSDLGICWDILESHQFSLLLSASYDTAPFPTGPKVFSNRAIEISGYIWGQLEHYLSGGQHVKFDMMTDSILNGIGNGDQNLVYSYYDFMRSVLFASVNELNFANKNYPVSIINGKEAIAGSKEQIDRNGQMQQIITLLMIRAFAFKLLNGDYPCFEPWMIYSIWRWLGEYRAVELSDRIFDLSPWW